MAKRHLHRSKTSEANFSKNETLKIFKAIDNSNIEYLSSLEDLSVDPNITNAAGDLAVHCAARKGDIEVLKQLMRLQGAKIVSAEDEWEESPLHIAVFGNKLKVIKFLVNNGADLQAADKYGISPLLRAIKYIKVDCQDLERVLKNDWAGEGEVQKRRVEIVKFLLENSTNEDIYPPHLDTIVQSNHLEILEQILKLGIDPDYQNSAFREAVMRKNLEAIKMLLAYGATTNYNHYYADISNEIRIKALIKCADAVDSLCASLTTWVARSSKFHEAIELEKVHDLLDALDDSEKLALSNRAFYKLVGGKDLTAAEIHQTITEFTTIISTLYNDNKIDLNFLNAKLDEVLNNIEEAGLFTLGGIPSLFSKALKILKEHDLWEGAITKNTQGVSLLPQNIVETEESRKATEHKLKESFVTARINLIEEGVDAVNNLGSEAGLYDTEHGV